MPAEFGEHLIRDQRPFLHPESLQIVQIHSSMLVLLQFSSPRSFSIGFRSEYLDGHGRSFILCSVTHFWVDFDGWFGLLSWWIFFNFFFLSVGIYNPVIYYKSWLDNVMPLVTRVCKKIVDNMHWKKKLFVFLWDSYEIFSPLSIVLLHFFWMKDRKHKRCRFIFTAAFVHIYQNIWEIFIIAYKP